MLTIQPYEVGTPAGTATGPAIGPPTGLAVEGAAAPWILGPPEGERYPIMDLGQVHIVGGASGAGKTTFVFQLIDAMRAGTPFLGFPTGNHPLVYCAFDRTFAENAQTMERVGLAPEEIPFMELRMDDPPEIGQKDHRFKLTMDRIREAHPKAKVIIIDGFWILVPHGKINDYLAVAGFLARVREYCTQHSVTIIGIVHTSKQKEGQRVIDPRQEMLGSVAGAGFTSCGILVKREKAGDVQDNKRTVLVLPRNLADAEFKMRVDGRGRLQLDLQVERDKEDALENYVASKPVGLEVAFAEIATFMEGFRMSRTTCHRRLEKLVDRGVLVRAKHGAYIRAGGSA